VAEQVFPGRFAQDDVVTQPGEQSTADRTCQPASYLDNPEPSLLVHGSGR
jgi:hypothetical protein